MFLNLTQAEAKEIAGQQHEDEVWSLVTSLRKVAEEASLQAALKCQCEELGELDEALGPILAEEVEGYLRDSFYAQIVHASALKTAKLEAADHLLAMKLDCDWAAADQMDASARNAISQEEARAGRDADLARCADELPDGAAYALMELQGSSSIGGSGAEQPAKDAETPTDGTKLAAGEAAAKERDATSVGEPAGAAGDGEDDTAQAASFSSAQGASLEAQAKDEQLSEDSGAPPPEDAKKRDCLSCMQSLPLAALINSCQEHVMCSSCFHDLCRAALRDTFLLPLSCCGRALPTHLAQQALDTSAFHRLLRLSEEKEAVHKMYCPSCSQFVNLGLLAQVEVVTRISCPGCSAELCAKCKSAWHPAVSCSEQPRSPEDVAFEHAASQRGWKRCPDCRMYVELKVGCNHMTCRCGSEFCYACLSSWANGQKTCNCPLWDERNLLLEGEHRQDRMEERLGRPLQQREIADLRAQLHYDNVVGNECDHRSKSSFEYREFARARTKRSGIRCCDNCGNGITSFAYECSGCRMRICQQCRFNRRIA